MDGIVLLMLIVFSLSNCDGSEFISSISMATDEGEHQHQHIDDSCWRCDIWADGCGFWRQEIARSRLYPITLSKECNKLCLDICDFRYDANSQCDHFTWVAEDGRCCLKNWSENRFIIFNKGNNWRCGFIPSRSKADTNALGTTVVAASSPPLLNCSLN